MASWCEQKFSKFKFIIFLFGFHRGRMSRIWNLECWYHGIETLLTTFSWIFQMLFMIAMPKLSFIFYAGITLKSFCKLHNTTIMHSAFCFLHYAFWTCRIHPPFWIIGRNIARKMPWRGFVGKYAKHMHLYTAIIKPTKHILKRYYAH